GELVALQLAQDEPGATAETDRNATACFERHRDRFLGPLADIQPEHDAWLTKFDWRAGFIRSAKLAIMDPADMASKGRLAEALELLLRHPSGRFLAELGLGTSGYYGHRAVLSDVFDVLARHAPASLRVLRAGDFQFPHDS